MIYLKLVSEDRKDEVVYELGNEYYIHKRGSKMFNYYYWSRYAPNENGHTEDEIPEYVSMVILSELVKNIYVIDRLYKFIYIMNKKGETIDKYYTYR